MKSLIAYTGNASFAARNAAFSDEQGVQRFFVRPDGWADVRIASIAGLEQLGLKADVDYRPGGTASSKLQVRWTREVVEAMGYEYVPVVETKRSLRIDPTAFLIAASK